MPDYFIIRDGVLYQEDENLLLAGSPEGFSIFPGLVSPFKGSPEEQKTQHKYQLHACFHNDSYDDPTHPEVNIVYGANADHSLAGLAAFENAGRGKAVKGKCLTEIFVGTDATEAELLKLFNPNSALKITQGLQPKANAEAEIDTMMKMVNKKLAWDKWVEIPTKDIIFTYWANKVGDGSAFLNNQYFMKTDLAAQLAKLGVK